MMFITFEGPEGSGKTTALASVAEVLEAEGHHVVRTREPGGSELGRTVRKVLLDGGEVAPLAEVFLFLADRAQHVQSLVRPVLEAGGVVLCDRYTDSTIVYQGHARGVDVVELRRLNSIATGGLVPAMTFLLDLPAEVGLARLTSRDRLDAEPLAFHEKVRMGFLAEAAREPDRWTVVNADQPAEDVASQILAVVKRKLRR
jgi:dTMP kinase